MAEIVQSRPVLEQAMEMAALSGRKFAIGAAAIAFGSPL